MKTVVQKCTEIIGVRLPVCNVDKISVWSGLKGTCLDCSLLMDPALVAWYKASYHWQP